MEKCSRFHSFRLGGNFGCNSGNIRASSAAISSFDLTPKSRKDERTLIRVNIDTGMDLRNASLRMNLWSDCKFSGLGALFVCDLSIATPEGANRMKRPCIRFIAAAILASWFRS